MYKTIFRIAAIVVGVSCITAACFAEGTPTAAPPDPFIQAAEAPVDETASDETEAAVSEYAADTEAGTAALMADPSECSLVAVTDGEPVDPVGAALTNGTDIHVAEQAPPAYTFTVNGYTYSLLDSDESGNWLIYCADTYGVKNMKNENGDTVMATNNLFDPNDETCVAYWLNRGFYEGEPTDSMRGNGTAPGLALDPAITRHIVLHDYMTEPRLADAKAGIAYYTMRCYITLMSYSEYQQYQDKIGYIPANGKTGSMTLLRSPLRGNSASLLFFSVNSGNTSNVNPVEAGWGPYQLRPMFYVAGDFFGSVKLDTYGSAVAEALRACNTEEGMAALGYSEDEIYDIFHQDDPKDESLIVRSLGVYGTPTPGYTLTLGYRPTGAFSEDATIIQWQESDSADGAYETVLKGSASYPLTNADGGKYIRAAVTLVRADKVRGQTFYSDPLRVSAAKTALTGTLYNGTQVTMPEKSDSAYTFTDGAYTYICLEAETDGLYVMADEIAGRPVLEVAPTDNATDPAVKNTITNWLNTAYLEGVSAPSGLPVNPNVLPYLRERVYETEGNGVADAPNRADNAAVCKVALPALHEIMAYGARIGYLPPNHEEPASTTGKWALRTPTYNSTETIGFVATAGGNIASCNPTQYNYRYYDVRPCMLIGYEYFQQVKLDVGKMGTEMKKLLRENVSRSALAALYSDAELDEIGYGPAAAAPTGAALTGIRAVGQQLTLAPDPLTLTADMAVRYRWFAADQADGVYMPLAVDTESYVLGEDDYDRVIKATMRVYSRSTGEQYAVCSGFAGPIAARLPLSAHIAETLSDTGTGKRAVCRFSNTADSDAAAALVIAAFDADGIMLDCTVEPVSVPAGAADAEVFVDSAVRDAAVYRVMVWNSEADAVPLCGRTMK